MASINELKGIISGKNGVARSNLFFVSLPSIPSVADKNNMNLLCTEVNLPGRQILSRERTIGLQTRQVAYGFAQEEVSMSFLLLNDYGAKRYFEIWQNLIVNQETLEVGYRDTYSKPVSIFQLDKIGRTVYKCDLIEAFPKTLNTVQLNNELDGLLQVNVSLSYTNWKPTYYENPAPTTLPVNTITNKIDLDLNINLGPFNLNIDII